jgi:hypothetical protein
MRKIVVTLSVAPLLTGTAMAAQPLADNQMDKVTAGFEAFSTADAQGLGKFVFTSTATVAQVSVVTNTSGTPVTASIPNGEVTLTLFKSISAASSSSTASNTLATTLLPISP